MLLSVKEILDSHLFKTATLKTGNGTVGDKSIEWVSVIEGPVENFVRENEFVLSTGIDCQTPEELLTFVKDVYDSGASALAIATGRYISTIPEEIICFAEENQFVIIELPWKIRFADIVHHIMNKLNELKQNDRKRSKDVLQHLIQKVLEGKTLEHITKYVELELNHSVLICNDKGEAIAGSAHQKDVFTLWTQLKKNTSLHESHHPMHSNIKILEKGNLKLFHLNIQSDSGHKGDFFILSESSKRLNEQEVTIAEQAVVAAALWFSRNSAVLEAERRMQNEFLMSLVKGERMSKEHVASHAAFFRYNLDLPYICIIGFPENLKDLINHNGNLTESREASLERMSIYIKEGMLYAAENVQRRLLFAYENDEVIVFLETSNSTTSDTVNQFLDLVERKLSHLLPGVIFSWGIGKEKDGIWHYTESYQKAKTALEMGRSQNGIGKRINFDETQINRLLLNLAMNEEVRAITISTVSPLVEYDKKRDMDLIHTCMVYNNNNGNVSQTARELNLHRQSLLYRLRKIESLTKLSLVDPDDLFLLNFSIKVWLTGVVKKEGGTTLQ